MYHPAVVLSRIFLVGCSSAGRRTAPTDQGAGCLVQRRQLASAPARHLMFLGGRRLSTPIHEVLYAEEYIASSLEYAAELEGPGDLAGRREEPKHLHRITKQPAHQHREAEALARACARIREDLRQRQRSLDRQTDVTDHGRVQRIQPVEGSDGEFAYRQADKHVEEKVPVPARTTS